MIAFVKGVLATKTQEAAYLEVNGIGYMIGMSTSDLSKLPEVGEEVFVHTYLQVREDALILFGFLTLEEKALFMQLIGVSGIGPKMGLAALSLYTPQELISHIATQDIDAISRIPGIGKKTASRIVLELKGSLDKELLQGGVSHRTQESLILQAAQEALLSMGFTSEEAELALKGAPQSDDEAGLLQYALKRLGE